MRTYEARVEEMHHRIRERKAAAKQRRFRLICAGAGSLFLASSLLIAFLVSAVRLPAPPGMRDGFAASIIAENDALGYIVICLTALLLGVAVTILCFRVKKRMDERETRDGR